MANTAPPPDHFILASTSPRRRQFLEALDIPFTVIAPGSADGAHQIDESPLPNEPPSALVQRLSQSKAQTVIKHLPLLFPAAPSHQNLVLLAADTEVAQDGEILGKPATPTEAAAMLKRLRRRPHAVYSGLTLVRVNLAQPAQSHWVTQLHHSQVWMRAYSDAEIEAYIATGSPMDKAGAYGIQDRQFAPVEYLEGCFASVMGFPLAKLAAGLHELGLQLPAIHPICRTLTGNPCCQE